MIVVIFEVFPKKESKKQYLDLAEDLKNELKNIDGFLSIERFASLQHDNKILSLSYWRDEHAVAQWRNMKNHRAAQKKGRTSIFDDYRLRVARVIRDYGMLDREQAPADSQR